jgi:polyisoprenoid-binding protein YceI
MVEIPVADAKNGVPTKRGGVRTPFLASDMKTLSTKFLFALFGLILFAGCGRAATVTPAPTLTTIPPTGTPQTGLSFNVVDAASIVNYEATLQIGGAKIGGTFAIRGQTVRAIPDDTGKYLLEIDIRFDGSSVTGANDLIVSALKSNLEVDKYPYGQFIAKSATAVALSDQPTLVTFEGTLEVHGVQRPFTLPTQVTLVGGKISATGTTTLDLLDYKVNVPTAIMKSQIAFTAKVSAEQTP